MKVKTRRRAAPECEWFEELGKPPYYQRSLVDLTVLTPREREVFEWLACGQQPREVAALLTKDNGAHLSRYTIIDHEKGIYGKLKLKDINLKNCRTSLTKVAADSGAIQLATGQPLQDLIDIYSSLTSRQREVLTFIAQGMKVREISKALELSRNTVPDYIKTIYQKFNIGSRAEAARIWIALKGEADRLMQEKLAAEKAVKEAAATDTSAPATEITNATSEAVQRITALSHADRVASESARSSIMAK